MTGLTAVLCLCLINTIWTLNTENFVEEGISANINLELDIVGGQEAAEARWPWHLELINTPNQDDWYGICGATLLKKGWAATAGHCVTDPDDEVLASDYRVLGGVSDLKDIKDNPNVQMINISQIIVHPDFNPKDPCAGHDIAMLKLETDMEFTSHVSTISLPSETDSFVGNDDCWIMGFGQTSQRSDESRYLLEANLPVMDNSMCGTLLGINLGSDYVCIGNIMDGFSVNSCRGDSGGPLSCKVGNKWVYAGLSSFGPESCEDAPSAYTSSPTQLSFIHQTINSNGNGMTSQSGTRVTVPQPICLPDALKSQKYSIQVDLP